MSRRRALQDRREGLEDIRGVINAMRTLAFLETRKLDRVLQTQQAIVDSLETVAGDLIEHHPALLPESGGGLSIHVVVGSERGFCGDFNQALISRLDHMGQPDHDRPFVIALGHKLAGLLTGDARLAADLPGASVIEEIDAVLNALVQTLSDVRRTSELTSALGIFHGPDDEIVVQTLLPPFAPDTPGARHPGFAHAPQLNMPPDEFFGELADQRLFAGLHDMLHRSLMAENHQRVTHLDAALHHMDEQSEMLKRQTNALRQEEVIEEIEVILLSTPYPKPG